MKERISLYSILLMICCVFNTYATQPGNYGCDPAYSAGLTAANEGSYLDAKNFFIRSYQLETNPSDRIHYYKTQAIAYCYYQLNDIDSALYYNAEYIFAPLDYSKLESADYLYEKAKQHIDANLLDLAISELQECITDQKLIIGNDHFLTARSRDWLSYAYCLQNRYNEAIAQKEDALTIYRTYYQQNDKLIVNTSISLANIYDYIGMYQNAYNVLTICLSALTPNDENYFDIRFKISRYLSIMGQHLSAIEFEEETSSLSADKPGIKFKSLCNKSEYNVALGKIQTAFSTIDEAINLCNDELPDLDVANALNIKANLFSICGDYLNALKFGKEALNLRTQKYKYHKDIAMSYNNIARYYSFLGLFTEAIVCQKQCINQYLELGYAHLPEMAAALNNYSDYYSNQKDYDKAIEYQVDALNILAENFTEYHPDYAIALNNLSKLYSLKEDYDVAIEYEGKVLAIRKYLFPEYHPDVAIAYSNLSAYYLGKKDYMHSIEFNEKAINIYKSQFGKNSPDYIRSMEFMADIYCEMKDYTKALDVLLPLETFYTLKFGIKSPLYMAYAKEMAFLYNRTADNKSSIKYIAKVEDLLDDYTLSTFECMTLNERVQFWERNKFWYYKLLPFLASEIRTPESISLLYNSLLTSKGILLSTQVEIEDVIKNSEDSNLINQWEHLRLLKLQLTYESSGVRPSDSTPIDTLLSSIHELEIEIMGKLNQHGNVTSKLRRKWKDIQAVLDMDEVAVEFCTVKTDNEKSRYIALVITPACTAPIMIDLCKEDDIIWPNEKNPIGNLDDYASKIWQPILSKLSSTITKLYFSPVGKLYNSAIEYSLNDCETISDSIKLYRLTSTRELVDLKNKNIKMESAVVYGGLKYELNNNSIDEFSTDDNVAQDVLSRNNFEYLPGSLKEANRISELLKASNIHTAEYSGHNGTEETFYQLNGVGINILHLATHGFYYKSDFDNEWISRVISQYPRQAFTSEDASMCRTGVVLSNAKTELLSGENVTNQNDGILTAKDISYMNLSGLSLAVLSACQTAQGDIGDDGVFGLQRGFKKAGADALLLSLWNVSDEATFFLMETFYKYVLKGMSYHDSLSLAQTDLRNFKNGRFDYPKYWAAFILLDSL